MINESRPIKHFLLVFFALILEQIVQFILEFTG